MGNNIEHTLTLDNGFSVTFRVFPWLKNKNIVEVLSITDKNQNTIDITSIAEYRSPLYLLREKILTAFCEHNKADYDGCYIAKRYELCPFQSANTLCFYVKCNQNTSLLIRCDGLLDYTSDFAQIVTANTFHFARNEAIDDPFNYAFSLIQKLIEYRINQGKMTEEQVWKYANDTLFPQIRKCTNVFELYLFTIKEKQK